MGSLSLNWDRYSLLSTRASDPSTAVRSLCASVPAFFRISRLSSVNSFIRTFDGALRPVFALSIFTSNGHAGFAALVIIANTVLPLDALNSDDDSATAGRRLLTRRLVNGNGTTTTS